MAAGHDGMPLARRTAIGLAALTLAALSGVLLPTGAHAGVVAPMSIVDKHSHDHSHGPGPTPTPSNPPTPGPTTPPTTDPPGTPPPGTPPPGGSPTTTPAQPGLPPPPPGGQPGVPAPPPGAPACRSGSQSTGNDPVLLGRNLTPADPDALSRDSDPVPDAAQALAVTDTVRLAGAAVPLWLVVGGGGFLVILVAVGLVLTLRDREREPGNEGLGIMDPPDPPASVRFG